MDEDPENRARAWQGHGVANPSDTEPRRLEAHVRDLLAALTGLHQLLGQLLELAGRKLAAMRGANVDALQQCAAEEGDLLQTLFEREKRRDAVLARLAQSLHWRDSARAHLSKIADRLPEPFASQIRARTAGLRQIATALQEKNRLAASVARNLHDHIRAVFEDVARGNQESVVYGPNGKHEQRNKQAWVDAVG